jgi:hypothetical protein
VKVQRYTFIKKRIITTDLDDLTGEAPSTPRDANVPDVSIKPKDRDGSNLLIENKEMEKINSS